MSLILNIDEVTDIIAELSNQIDELNLQISSATNANYNAIVLGQITARDLKRLHNKLHALVAGSQNVTQQNKDILQCLNTSEKVTQQTQEKLDNEPNR